MIIVEIINPNGLYYGVYDNAGKWTQANLSNPPTDYVVLVEEPTEAGDCLGDLVGDESYARTESIFNVKFEPVEEGFFASSVISENGQTAVEGRSWEPEFNFSDDTNKKIIGWYK